MQRRELLKRAVVCGISAAVPFVKTKSSDLNLRIILRLKPGQYVPTTGTYVLDVQRVAMSELRKGDTFCAYEFGCKLVDWSTAASDAYQMCDGTWVVDAKTIKPHA